MIPNYEEIAKNNAKVIEHFSKSLEESNLKLERLKNALWIKTWSSSDYITSDSVDSYIKGVMESGDDGSKCVDWIRHVTKIK